jgi:DNA-binding GntR family transcriptional regulator
VVNLVKNKKQIKQKQTLVLAQKESTSLADLATTELRNKILDLSLAPSEHLEERMLLEKFPFGRTPIREALNRLMAEGLVESKNGRGAYVASMSIWHTHQLLEAYVIIEKVVASLINFTDKNLVLDLKEIQKNYEIVGESAKILAITESNSNFHSRLAESTGNRFIVAQAADLHNLARRLSYFIYRSEQEVSNFSAQLERINRQHHEIIAFIEQKNRSELVSLLTEHAVLFRLRLSAVISGGNWVDIDFSPIRL